MKIGIITLAYDEFDFESFYQHIEKYFLPTHTKTFYFFTNKTEYIFNKNVQVYFAKKNVNVFTNISDLIEDVKNDEIQVLFYCGIKIKFTDIDLGSQMLPNDDYLFISLNQENVPTLYNFSALIEHIEGHESETIYGAYTNTFIDLIKYYIEES
jgi:hypothetical protein